MRSCKIQDSNSFIGEAVSLKGSYCLIISVLRGIDLRVGALGIIAFPPGTYIYVGSALNSLEARINRHVRTSTGSNVRLHWHVDYLLRREGTRLEEVWFKESEKRGECLIASEVSGHGSPIKGFGCSDCACVSHLFRVDETAFLEALGFKPWKEKLYDVLPITIR
jgi:Uri superfamily endonuclease